MYLLDTNVMFEMLLNQERTAEVKELLDGVSPTTLYLSEFALYSIGIRLVREKQANAFARMVNDLIILGGIRVVRLDLEDMSRVAAVSQRDNLDFDDAYQYVVAEKFDLTLVSFDSDFDRTKRGRKTPQQILDTL